MERKRNMTTARTIRIGLPLVLTAAIGLPLAGRATASNAPAAKAPTVVLPAALPATTACTASVDKTTAVCNLYARKGQTTLAGTTVNTWYYSSDPTPVASGTDTPPGGPVLDVPEGAVVTVNLSDELGVATGLLFQGQTMVPDTAGTTTTKSYTFTASKPGTFLYEAALLPDAEYQTAMGLYGALVVRSNTAGKAYDSSAESVFDDEALVVLSEVDPKLNNAADPSAFDMRDYAPTFGLVNGASGPGAIATTALPTQKLLLRYVNAGVQPHSMTVLGLNQRYIANDGNAFQYPHDAVAETFGPGQSEDTIVVMPASGGPFALYDGAMNLRSGSGSHLGGMVTFITPTAGTPVPTPATVSNLVATPTTVTATITTTAAGGVTAAQAFVDSTSGTAIPMTVVAGSFGSPSVQVTATFTPALAGSHTVYVQGQDVNGWGPALFATVVNDTTGPTTSTVAVTPSLTNGSTSLALTATGNDTASGGSSVTAAEYSVGTTAAAAGSGTAITVFPVQVVAPLSATIPQATVNSWAPGPVTIWVRSKDAMNNWGAAVSTTVTIDKTGPVASALSVSPNPNNGTMPFNANTPAVRVTAMLVDGSNVVAGEGFIDAVGTTGQGFPFGASDGTFNSGSEAVQADIPLSTVALLATGNHTVYVHGKDAAGNWGVTATVTLTVDRTAPTISAVTLSQTTIFTGTPSVTMTVAGADVGTGVVGGEFWVNNATNTPGTGTAFTSLSGITVPTSSLTAGTTTVYVRLKDALNNWSASKTATLTVVNDAIFSNGFDPNANAWSQRNGSLSFPTAVKQAGSNSLQVAGNAANYVQSNVNPTTATYDARFYFRPSTASNGQAIFQASSGTSNSSYNSPLFQVRYRNTGTPQVQLQVGTTTNANWVTINAGAFNRIEVTWTLSGQAVLYVNGTVASQTLTASNNSIGSIRLGSVTGGNSNTTMNFDTFASKHSTSPLIGA